MAIETVAGDFVIKAGWGRHDILRIHMTDESMVVTASENSGGDRHVIIADISEAKELRDWIARRLDEAI